MFFKKHKFNAKPQTVSGVKYDSAIEVKRHAVLNLAVDNGNLKYVRRATQSEDGILLFDVPYDATGMKCRKMFYVPDFVYQLPDDTIVLEDCKGLRTPEFNLKMKALAAIHPNIIIYITKSPKSPIPTSKENLLSIIKNNFSKKKVKGG